MNGKQPAMPFSYDDWLRMPDEGKDHLHQEIWNVHRREGVAFAFLAAARLALQSAEPVLDISVGAYHGNEWVLQLCVADEHIEKLPPMLTQRFEGFRVAWMSESVWQGK